MKAGDHPAFPAPKPFNQFPTFMAFKEALRNRNFFLILIDLLMMVLLMINLSLILFDWIYEIELVNGYLQTDWPEFYGFYEQNIHVNFFEIDMVFVAIFLTEFFLSWTIAIVQKRYDKWFFYPFIHWYDILGCIPLDAFRFVRVLRIYSIIYRLHKLRLINLRNTFVYRKLSKYYEILVEEVSDRVVVNILNGIQDEVKGGGPVLENIVQDILRPKKELIAEWISHRLKVGVAKNYAGHRTGLKVYIDGLIDGAVQKSEDISSLELLPVVGKAITATVKKTVSDVVYHVIDSAMSDLASDQNRVIVGEMADFVFDSVEFEEQDVRLQEIIEETLVQSLEVVKDQVKVKQWKLKEISEKEERRKKLADRQKKSASENPEDADGVVNMG
jgi:hypothetical protein